MTVKARLVSALFPLGLPTLREAETKWNHVSALFPLRNTSKRRLDVLRLSSKSKRVLAATSTSVKSLKVVDLRVYSSLQPAKFPRCVFHHRGQIILLDGEAPL